MCVRSIWLFINLRWIDIERFFARGEQEGRTHRSSSSIAVSQPFVTRGFTLRLINLDTLGQQSEEGWPAVSKHLRLRDIIAISAIRAFLLIQWLIFFDRLISARVKNHMTSDDFSVKSKAGFKTARLTPPTDPLQPSPAPNAPRPTTRPSNRELPPNQATPVARQEPASGSCIECGERSSSIEKPARHRR